MMKEHIVVIDDDQSVLKAFEKVLSAQNFAITIFNRSVCILGMIRRKRPKVVIVDMKIPNENDRELVKRIKQIDKNIVVIIITSYSNILTKRDAFLLGADDYFQKPFEIDALLSRLHQFTSK
jgi:DNA-binding NtrC family response regulator